MTGHGAGGRTTALLIGARLAVGLSASAPAAAAQDTLRVRLIGEVRDYTTEQPVANIAVKIVEIERVVLTDRNGYFTFDSVPVGRLTFEASGFGYHTSTEASDVAARSLLLIRLEPAPFELEGLYVSTVQRLVRRRLAVPSRVVAWDKSQLERAIAPDNGTFIKTQGVATFVMCGGEFSQSDLPNCFLHKGRPTRLTIFVDDLPLLPAAGTMQLWSFDPRDLFTVEFLPGCRQLRIYTQLFMQLVEEGRVRLQPAICF